MANPYKAPKNIDRLKRLERERIGPTLSGVRNAVRMVVAGVPYADTLVAGDAKKDVDNYVKKLRREQR